MMFIPIIFLGLIIWAIIVFTRRSNASWRSNGDSSNKESAIEILKRRYARGEVSKEEFDEMKKNLI